MNAPDFQSLAHFKHKFGPTWHSLFLAYRDAFSLPRVGYAVLSACAPWLRAVDLPGLAVSAVRGMR